MENISSRPNDTKVPGYKFILKNPEKTEFIFGYFGDEM